jgi:hypothetical protein
MQGTSKFEVVIETDGAPISTEELTDFLYHFRAVYAAALNLTAQAPASSQTRQDDLDLVKQLRSDIGAIDWKGISDLAHEDLGDQDLGIIDIRRQNPLTIVFDGVVVALTVAVIISGGKLNLGPLKVQLPPLGKGLQELRAAFGRPPKAPSPTKKIPRTRKP